jgi:hypothetical protein
MTSPIKTKLHAFERALILGARPLKSGSAVRAVGAVTALSASLAVLGQETFVATNGVAKAAFMRAEADLAAIAAALDAGARDTAIGVYARLLEALPTIHSALWSAAPAQLRGNDPTEPEALLSAVKRALEVLGG